MTICVIQNRPLMKYHGCFYTFNPCDIEKYLKLCDQLIYLASDVELYEKPQKCKLLDYPNLNIQIVDKKNFADLFKLTKRTRDTVKSAIKDSDLVVIKIPSMTLGKWAYQEVLKSEKKYILEVIGCAWDGFWYHDIKGKILAPIHFGITRWMIKSAQNVVYVTNRFLQKRYPNNNNNIGCSNVVLETCDENVLIQRKKRIEKSKLSSLVLGTAGAVNVRYKGQEYVIRALARLKAEGFIFHYNLAGGGSNTFLLDLATRLNVADLVHFWGTVPKNCMVEFYDSLDIYIHPSFAEGLPRVLIEAESRALPALGAKAAGTPELLSEDCVYSKKDVTEIVSMLKSFTRDKMLRTAEENFERSKLYALNILDEKRRQFYNEIMEE